MANTTPTAPEGMTLRKCFFRLKNLKGRKKKLTDAYWFTAVEEALKLAAAKIPATCAGSTGAINVWTCDDGTFRADRAVYGSARSSCHTQDPEVLKAWLEENFPLISYVPEDQR